MEISKTLITHLLQSKSIIIDPTNPFRWSSGWKSPIYCDNRKTLSYPVIRNFIRDAFITLMKKEFPKPDIIAGVATGAIAHAALVASVLELPLVYVRSARKEHGTGNLIEGDTGVGKSVLVIEDLVSTGASSLRAVTALKEAGCNVLGMMAIFTYGFRLAEERFHREGIRLVTLAGYDQLIREAVSSGTLGEKEAASLEDWRRDPEHWKN